MELGSGIALGGLCVSAAAVSITAIRAKAADKKDSADTKQHCLDHSGIDVCLKGVTQRLDSLHVWMGKISDKIDIISDKL